MPKVPIAQILTKNLEELMAARDVNQQRLSEKTGLSVSTISELRRGLSDPGIGTLEIIADVLKVQVWELLVNDAETRRRAIERALRHDPGDEPAANEPLPIEKVRPIRKGVALRQRKKPAKARGIGDAP